LWTKILKFRCKEYPNVCKLVALLLAMGPSNSTVEKGFSMLNAMMSDRRLSLGADTMEDLFLVKGNQSVWSPQEVEEILSESVERYLGGHRRKLKVDSAMELSFGEISGAQGEGGLGEPEEGGEAQDSDDCMSGESDDDIKWG
jgi:hypothetical protein